MFPYCKYPGNEIKSYLLAVTPDAVRGSLENMEPKFSDFLNYISPAAESLMPELREHAATVRRMYFGKTVRLYGPLYISNICINDCLYCGFRTSYHEHKRRRLTFDEIMVEAKIIKGYGMDSLLLVSGEDPIGVSVDFLVKVIKELKKMFSYISIEIYPMNREDYSKLFEAGVHGLTIYQETYDQELYKKLHRRGPKTDYLNRLNAIAAGGEAGFYNLGMGALLGLNPDWRLEAVSVAAHGLWIRKHFWKSKIQFSFPRITPVEGGFQVPAPVSESNLEQMMLAFRLFFHEADLFISTRESHDFRTRIVKTCASHISAGSQVAPGGYEEYERLKDKRDLGQFTITDPSSVAQVVADMKAQGLEPVFKDWDSSFGA
jgi:2-iminoacetate synthase